MSLADLEAVLAVDVASFRPSELVGAQKGDVGEDPRAVRERQLREELQRPWARLRVARRDGAIVGYALFWHVADEIHLLNVAVAPEERRRGAGRGLVEDVSRYAREHAAAKILLEVRASNAAALALYGALGFATFNVRRGYYADGEDAVEMQLSFDPGAAGPDR